MSCGQLGPITDCVGPKAKNICVPDADILYRIAIPIAELSRDDESPADSCGKKKVVRIENYDAA
jgi:hypothetical protein